MTDRASHSPLVIRACGAVSAAGWQAADLLQAVLEQREIPSSSCPRAFGPRDWDCRLRPVPPAPPDALPKHARLRRVSNVSRFAVAAAAEAMAGVPAERLGIIVCLTNGCVVFTNRFYNEVIDTPAFASPILFPETVFNAPASHIAACLGVDGPVTTLIGESNLICEALRTAADWMRGGLVQHCLVIGAEEADWLSTEAVGYYDKRAVVTEGAGALLVALDGPGPRISDIAGPFAYHTRRERSQRLKRAAAELEVPPDGMLITGASGMPHLDRGERRAWAEKFPAAEQVSPMQVLGEGMGCKSALQLVAAAGLAQCRQVPAVVSMPGGNTAAYTCVIRPG